jgi:hypothetical protein
VSAPLNSSWWVRKAGTAAGLSLALSVASCGLPRLVGGGDEAPALPFAEVLDDPNAAASTILVTPTVSIGDHVYPSLLAAVLSAQDGDVLRLDPGLHGGPIDVRTSLTLEPSASLGAVTIHSRSATCVSVRGDVDVVLRGFTLRADGLHGESRKAAVTVDGGSLSLEYCHVGARANCAVQVIGGSLTMEQCSVAVDGWQTAILVAEGSEASISDCRVENRAQPGTAVEVWGAQAEITGGRLAATAAVVVAGTGGTMTVDGTHLIDGGAVALQGGSLSLEDCNIVGSDRAAARCFGLLTLARSHMQDHDLGLIVSGPEARLTVLDCQWTDVHKAVFYEDGATEDQLFMTDSSLLPGRFPAGS